MFPTSVVPRMPASRVCGNRFKSSLPTSLLALGEAQEKDRHWREIFDIYECSAEDRLDSSEGLAEYCMIRDFVLEKGKNVNENPAFKEFGVRFSSWLKNNEHHFGDLQYLMQQYPFVNMKEMKWILSDGRHLKFPYVWAFEWQVNPGHDQDGKGDLVLTDGKNDFMVLEAKWLSQGVGKTYQSRRTHNRKKVKEQARTYRDVVQSKYSSCTVSAAILTNDPPDVVVRYFRTGEAKRDGFAIRDFEFLTPSVQVID